MIERFEKIVKKYPRKVAVRDPFEELTYKDLQRRVKKIAGILPFITRKDKVGIMLPATAAFASIYFGCLYAKKTPVPLNFFFSKDEIKFILTDAGIDTVFSIRYFCHLLEGSSKKVLYVNEMKSRVTPRLPILSGFFRRDFLATLLYTSGTTGRPKGVKLSARNLLANVDGCTEAVGFDDTVRMLAVLPLFHSFALTTTLLVPLFTGAEIFFMPKFDPHEALEAIEKYGLDRLIAIPSMIRLLNKFQEEEKADVSSLKTVVSGAEPLHAEDRESFNKLFSATLIEGYGLTEASPVVSVNPLDENRPGSVGRPLYNVRVKIVDDRGVELPPGEVGEIYAKGPSIMEGYYGLDDETAAVLADGWLRTGDYGMLDEDGYLYVTGRKKEMIIISGENVFPREIEDALIKHPGVFEAAVIGIPDENRSEVPKAFVVPREGCALTDGELRSFCRKHLAGFKVPKVFEIRDELPHGPTGKILKKELR